MTLNKFRKFLAGKEDYIFGKLAIVMLIDYPSYHGVRDLFRIGPRIYRAIKIGNLAFGWEISR